MQSERAQAEHQLRYCERLGLDVDVLGVVVLAQNPSDELILTVAQQTIFYRKVVGLSN